MASRTAVRAAFVYVVYAVTVSAVLPWSMDCPWLYGSNLRDPRPNSRMYAPAWQRPLDPDRPAPARRQRRPRH